MIDASFVKAIQDNAKTEVLMVENREYATKPMFNPPWPDEPRVEALAVDTLTGLCDYVKDALDRDQLKASELLIHIESATVVRLYSAIKGVNRRRETYIVAEVPGDSFKFNEFLSHWHFMIGLQTLFLDYGDRTKLMQLVGTIKDEQIRTNRDDGISQTIVAAQGIALNAEVQLPNPVMLKPYRTFAEIDQPPSQFIVRVQASGKGLPQVGLFEGDGGRWNMEAVDGIEEFLKTHVATTGVVILA